MPDENRPDEQADHQGSPQSDPSGTSASDVVGGESAQARRKMAAEDAAATQGGGSGFPMELKIGFGVAAAGLVALAVWPDAKKTEEPGGVAETQATATEIPAGAIDSSMLTGPDDRPPKLKSGSVPEVTDDIALAPTIVLRVHLDATGSVVAARVYRPRIELAAFEEAALHHIRTYTFEPARKDGKPVAITFNYPMSFNDAGPRADVTLTMKGSDTIGGSLGPELARTYRAVRPDVKVEIEALGSRTGFTGLLDQTADIGASSRPVEQAELREASKRGVKLKEFVIGYDGIAVIVNEKNPVGTLSVDQVAQVFSGQVANWKELGGFDQPIRLISRPAYSGTHAVFKERILGGRAFSSGTEYVESSDAVSRKVADDRQAIAYVGLGWVGPRAKVVGLRPEPEADPVKPDEKTIREGTYPIYRPLLLYTAGIPNPEVAEFLRYVVSPPGQKLVTQAGFLPGITGLPIPSQAELGTSGPAVTRVYFETEDAALDARATASLDVVAKLLTDQTDKRALVVGHVDAGAKGADLTHSMDRGQKVVDYLTTHGVSGELIDLEGQETDKSTSAEMTAAQRAAIRRVDIFVVENVGREDADVGAEEPAGAEKLVQK